MIQILSEISAALVPKALAQVFGSTGNPLADGFELFKNRIGGLFQGTLKEIVVRILIVVLDLVGIVAVGMIIIAGIYLITGQGEEDSKTKAKNILIWTIAGLTVIVLSRVLLEVILGFITSTVN